MSWGTQTEIEFLKNIGRNGRNESIGEQIQVLQGYIRGSRMRNWGHINGKKAMAFAKGRLEMLEYLQTQKEKSL